jgi:hypothetical protein
MCDENENENKNEVNTVYFDERTMVNLSNSTF